jgi:formylglycine-generating enzyme required for sulfatase activity
VAYRRPAGQFHPRAAAERGSEFLVRRLDTPDEETAYHRDRVALAADTAGDSPVSLITWLEARDYCRWAGGRLSMEAGWEKAARGTDRRWFPWGNNVDPQRANVPLTTPGLKMARPPPSSGEPSGEPSPPDTVRLRAY